MIFDANQWPSAFLFPPDQVRSRQVCPPLTISFTKKNTNTVALDKANKVKLLRQKKPRSKKSSHDKKKKNKKLEKKVKLKVSPT